MSSTTKVLTVFDQLEKELKRPEFRFVVPDFRLNRAFDRLDALSPQQKQKVEFLCNECCWFACPDRKACYETSAAGISVRTARSMYAPRRTPKGATAFPTP